jgi:uncharacterized protein
MRSTGARAASKMPAVPDARDSIFCLPAGGVSLVYAPLHGLAAVMRNEAAERLAAALRENDRLVSGPVGTIATHLLDAAAATPQARSGPLSEPLFLGVVPTRGCNMACGYCDFAAPKSGSPTMDLHLARAAVEGYLVLLDRGGHRHGAVHFFGGEPFRAPNVVEFIVEFAARRASELGIALDFEASTNGFFSSARAEWVADRFSTIVLSLDGPARVQDRQRPALHARPTFSAVARTAKILSDGSAELIVRSCVTAASVDLLPEWATWISRELRPSTVCFESLTRSASTAAAGFRPPDPYRFARQFAQAALILDKQGITTVQSTSDLRDCRISACPVGQDALIVSPDGAVDACYLLEKEWRDQGLELRLGLVNVAARSLEIEDEALERTRRLAARHKPLCANCFCQYHCAGGCHVHHDTNRPAAAYDDMCVATRLITADKVLRRLGLTAVADRTLTDPVAAHSLARHADDRLIASEVP